MIVYLVISEELSNKNCNNVWLTGFTFIEKQIKAYVIARMIAPSLKW